MLYCVMGGWTLDFDASSANSVMSAPMSVGISDDRTDWLPAVIIPRPRKIKSLKFHTYDASS